MTEGELRWAATVIDDVREMVRRNRVRARWPSTSGHCQAAVRLLEAAVVAMDLELERMNDEVRRLAVGEG